MHLAGPAFMNAQHIAYFAQAELPRVPQPDHRAIPYRQPLQFLPQNFRPLVVREHVVGRMLRRRGDTAFRIHIIFSRHTRNGHTCEPALGQVDALRNQVSARPSPELRESGERHAALGAIRSQRLQKTKVSGLNQIGHFDTRSLGQPRQYPSGKDSDQPGHILV